MGAEQNMRAAARHIIQGVFTDEAAIVTARLLEDDIERRGLGWEYAQTLLRAVAYPDGVNRYDRKPHNAFYQETQPTDKDLFPLIRATPEQRARAYLEAVNDA